MSQNTEQGPHMKTVFLKQNENSGWSVFHVKLASQNVSFPQRLLKDRWSSSASSIFSWTTKLVQLLYYLFCRLLNNVSFSLKWERDGKYSQCLCSLMSTMSVDIRDQLFWVCLFLHHGDFWKGDNRQRLARSLCFEIVVKLEQSFNEFRRICSTFVVSLKRFCFSLLLSLQIKFGQRL